MSQQSFCSSPWLHCITLPLLLGAQFSVPLFAGQFWHGPSFTTPFLGSRAAIAADDQGLGRIRRRKRLIVGVKDNLPPLGYRNESGELVGFEIEIARRLATELLGANAEVEFKPLNNRDRLPALFRGEVDLVIAQVTATADRQRLVQFSPPYYTSGIQLITPTPGITQLNDIQYQRVGVLRGSDAVAIVKTRLPRASLVFYNTYRTARAGLDQGDIDAFAGDAVVLAGWRQGQEERYSTVGPRISSAPLAIAFPKGLQNESLRQRLETIVRQWQGQGWLQQQATQWGLPRQ